MFPPYVRGADAALDYLTTWCDIIGGELLDGIGWDEIVDGEGRLVMLQVRPFRIRFSVGTVLSVAFAVGADLTAHLYRFDLRQDGELCWRHDCHAGHEYLGSGPYHLHIGPDEGDRRPDESQTLQTIFEHVTAENLHRSWQRPGD